VADLSNAQTQGSSRLARFAIYALLALVCLYYLMPLFILLSTSLKTLDDIRTGNLLSLPKQITLEPWQQAWSSACIGVRCEGMSVYFWNSFRFVVPAVLLSTLIGAFNGYVLTMWRFRGSEFFFAALMIGCFIPFQVVLLPMARTLGALGISNTVTGLIFVHVIYGVAFTTLFFRNYYISIPDELVKAAKIEGAGFLRIFWRIILPLSTPIIVVSIIWQFTQIWNDFLFGVVFSTGDRQPVTVALNNLVNTSTGVIAYNVNMAAAIIAALPTLFVYIVAGKYFVRGLTAGAVKG
jgi:glucose/mannose transport system permease protein